MTPIWAIRKAAQKTEVLDIEFVAARIDHHSYKISINNNLFSDTGDQWMCELKAQNGKVVDIKALAPSLRGAVLLALKKAAGEEV